MNIYKALKEEITVGAFKDILLPILNKLSDLIGEYVLQAEEEDRPELLNSINQALNLVVEQFDSIGYTYVPEVAPDEPEDIFVNILDNYRESIGRFINDFDQENFEAFNTETRNIQNLIEVHRTSYMKEGEILTENM